MAGATGARRASSRPHDGPPGAPRRRLARPPARCTLWAWLTRRDGAPGPRRRPRSRDARTLRGRRTRHRQPVDLGAGRRAGRALGVRAGARIAGRRQHQRIVSDLFIGGADVAATGGRTFTTLRPGHGGAARARSPRADVKDVDKAVDRRAQGVRGRWGALAGPGARQVPVPHRAHPPGAVARVRGARDARRRQAHQGVAGRGRAARGRPFLVLRGLGGQARVRVPQPRPRGPWAWPPRSSPGTSRC